MLPKKRRISRKYFKDIITIGKRYNSSHLLVYILKNKEEELSKFSFSISKKVLKSAVDRNKFRRRGYSIINRHLDSIKPNYLCFFSFKKGSETVRFNDLEKEILDLLKNVGVLL